VIIQIDGGLIASNLYVQKVELEFRKNWYVYWRKKK